MSQRLPREEATAESVLRICEEYDIPAADYLQAHVTRFLTTRALLMERWNIEDGSRVLDIGAHWLHNAICYAMTGFEVTASDLAVNHTLTHPSVVAMAGDYGIRLLPFHDLSNPVELEALPSDSFDVILFTEILEHITFNPVKMWSVLYQLLRPGGRIVVTTPNYHVRTFLEDAKNLLQGKSCGIAVGTLLEINTYGPHWKEYSANDVREYFERLSPDFRVSHLQFTDPYPGSDQDAAGFLLQIKTELTAALPANPQLAEGLASHLAQFAEVRCFKRSLHVEIDLAEKSRGIVVQPHW
jgi:2-polyprenyl-3-methyl-5-hydroxy-6-metoxy-1,4-benzoquinol methylase